MRCDSYSIENFVIPFHPGVVLKDYLSGKMSQKELSKITGIHRNTISAIINGKRSITVQTAIKLGKAFTLDARFWCNLQLNYDIARERICQKEKE